jgi:hypothetical protein
MKIEPKKYENVPINTTEQNNCSPREPMDLDWRGILINAPTKVYFKKDEIVDDFGAFVQVPVCGYYLLEAEKSDSNENMKIIARNIKNNIKYEGLIFILDYSPEEPPPFDELSFSKEELEGISVGSYFNYNIINFVDLPVEEAKYEVWVNLNNIESNKVIIELLDEKDGDINKVADEDEIDIDTIV